MYLYITDIYMSYVCMICLHIHNVTCNFITLLITSLSPNSKKKQDEFFDVVGGLSIP